MCKAILMELNIEGSPETVGVKYKEYLWRDPEIVDVVAGTVSVKHLLSPHQHRRISRALNNHVKKQPFGVYMRRFMESVITKRDEV